MTKVIGYIYIKLLSLLIANNTKVSYFSFRNADQVSIGDEVLIQENEVLKPQRVIQVSSFIMQGKDVNNF